MDHENGKGTRLTRRRLLQTAGGAAAAAGLTSLPGCGGDGTREKQIAVAAERVDAPQFPPLPPSQLPANCSILSFFTPDEAQAVEALTARLLPGSPDDPGATEACVTRYIDQKLGRFDAFATPTYFKPPFAKPAKGHPIGVDGDTVYVPEELLPRYGFQSSLAPQEAYRNGLEQLDEYARRKHGKAFVELSGAQQDGVIEDLEGTDPTKPPGKNAKAVKAVFKDPSGFGFFSMLQEDTSEGMFADPVYGGNRNYVGWALIGYPGAQRAYTPGELKTGPRNRRVQGLVELEAMHPGRIQEHVILPLEGTKRVR